MKNPYFLFLFFPFLSGPVFAGQKPQETVILYRLDCSDAQTKKSFHRDISEKVDLRNECPSLVEIQYGIEVFADTGKSFFLHLTGRDQKRPFGACMYTNIAPATYLVEISLASKGESPNNAWTDASSEPGKLNCSLYLPEGGD